MIVITGRKENVRKATRILEIEKENGTVCSSRKRVSE